MTNKPVQQTFAQWQSEAIAKAKTSLATAIPGSDSIENIETLCGSEGVMIFAFNNGETPAEHIFMQWHELGLQFSEGQAIHLTLDHP